MEDNSSNNKRIAKNTIYLYLRMLVTLVVSLYTSRVILNNLGIEDFGIYNLVAGVLVLFSFISTALRNSTQRFVSFELGLGEKGNTNRIFCMSLQCILLIAIIITIIAETIGLWFIFAKLDIPESRVSAVHWVYQISIVTFIVNLFQVPLYATIIAYEKMSFYAYLSIADVLLKLGVSFLISISLFDKLIVYALLLFFVTSIGTILAALYCKYSLRIGSVRIVKDKHLFCRMMNFSGWSMVNGAAVISAQQGGNMLLNVFNGVTANAAYGIANQMTNAVYYFISSFQSAFQPQIVKQYAAERHEELSLLMNRTSVFSYYLLLIIVVPFAVSIEYILRLWLGQIPEYAAGFCILMLLYFFVDALEAPLWMLIGATGKMKVYTIWSTAIAILNIPLSWLLLKNGFSVYWVFIVRAGLNYLCAIIRPLYVKYLVKTFSLRRYIAALIRPLMVSIIIGLTLILLSVMSVDIHPLSRIFITFSFIVMAIWFTGLGQIEKKWIVRFISNIFKR